MTTCPSCQKAISSEDINVAKDVAMCRACNRVFSLSALVNGVAVSSSMDLTKPPTGAWCRDHGVEIVIGATVRSIAIGVVLAAMAITWNSVLIGFLIKAIGASHKSAVKTASGNTASTTYLILFMIPFVVSGVGMAVSALFCWFGRVEVRLRGSEGTAFVGLGFWGWKRRFDPAKVSEVTIGESPWTQNGRSIHQILLKGPDIRFGKLLTSERLSFVASALAQRLRRS